MTSIELGKQNLKESMENLNEILDLLRYILKKIQTENLIEKIENKEYFLNYEERILISSFFQNFSLAVDILLNRILRSLDIIEQEDISRKLDIVIRAEKRGFVKDYKELIKLKDLRNKIAHEYLKLTYEKELLKLVLDYIPLLFDIYKKVHDYAKRYRYI